MTRPGPPRPKRSLTHPTVVLCTLSAVAMAIVFGSSFLPRSDRIVGLRVALAVLIAEALMAAFYILRLLYRSSQRGRLR